MRLACPIQPPARRNWAILAACSLFVPIPGEYWGGMATRSRDGAVSLLAGLSGATAMCEIVKPDWSMARYGYLVNVSRVQGYPLISVADLIAYVKHVKM